MLEHIAADLLAMHFAPEPSVHGASGERLELFSMITRTLSENSAVNKSRRLRLNALQSREGTSCRGLTVRMAGCCQHDVLLWQLLPACPLPAVLLDRSVRGGRAMAAAERSVHGGREGSRHGRERVSLKGMTLAALAAVRTERSVHGGDRSTRGGERSARGGAGGSMRGGERSARGGLLPSLSLSRAGSAQLDPSVRGGALVLARAGSAQLDPSVRSASLYLPIATPFSQRLAQLFDQLQLKPGEGAMPSAAQGVGGCPAVTARWVQSRLLQACSAGVAPC